MGLFKKVFKGIGKVFKKIGKGVKSVFKKFGKFMGKIGIVGNIAMMFILPGIGAALMKGFGAIWTGAIGQTAAQATAAANAATQVAGNTATQAAIAGATDAAAGEVIKQTALKAATKTAMSAIRAGGAITQKATGMLASELAVVRGAGMVLQKGAQFASTIQAGYKTVSQAVTGAFTETGKWIGGKLGMKTAEGAAMQGSWANYSQAVTDSFATLKDNATDFWSPIKAGPSFDVGLDNFKATGSTADKLVNSTSNIASATGPELDVSGDFGTGAAMPRSELNVSGDLGTDFTSSSTPRRVGGEYGFEIEIDKLNTVVTEPTVDFGSSTGSTGFDVTDPTNLNRSLLDRATTYVTGTPERLYKGAKEFIAQTPGRVLKSEATGALYDAAGLTPEQQVMEEQSRFGGYVPEFRGNADAYAQTMGYDFGQYITGMEQTVGPYGEPEGQFGGADAYKKYLNSLQNYGAMA